MSYMDYYDHDGNPISMEVFAELMNNRDYKIIQQDELPNGRWVSTVWLGMDHAWGDGQPPLIFETMVFPSHGNFSEMLCERYATVEEAKAGHIRALALAADNEWFGYDDE